MPTGAPPQVRPGTFVSTTDATATEIWARETRTNKIYAVYLKLIAAETTDSDEGALYTRQALYKNDAGTLTLISSNTIGTDIESDNTWTGPTIDANGTEIRIQVTGKLSTNITWNAIVDIYEIPV